MGSRNYQSRKIDNDWQFLTMKSPFYLQIRSYLSRITGFPVYRTHVSLDHAGFSIFEAHYSSKQFNLKE